MNTIDVNINGSAVLDQAMRRVRDHWSLAYSKLLAMRWEPTSATSYGCTDGRTLKLNPAGLARIGATSDPVGLTAFLLVHEALHALLSHGERLSHLKDHNTANIAADYIINAMIKRRNSEIFAKSRIVPFPFIEGILFDEAISKDFDAVELYQRLLKSQPPQPPQPPDDGDEAGDEAGDQSGDGGDQSGDQSDQSGDGGDEAGEGGEAGDGGDGGDEAGSGGGKSNERKTDKEILGDEWVGTGAVDTAKPELSDNETAEEAAAAIDAANESILIGDEIDSRAGMDGAGGSRQVQAQRAKRDGLDWADVLRQWLTARCATGWDKPFNAPIYSSTGTICAARSARALPEIVVVVDTSCSVPDSLLAEMLAQLQDCLDKLHPEAIHLVACDHQVREAHELREGDTVPNKLRGGGGTLFAPAFEWLRDNVPNAEGMIYLTDGEAWDGSKIEEPTCPMLWLDYGKAGASAYPFGEVVSFTHR